MSDLIDRQAAIDALDFEIVYMTAYCDWKNGGNPLAQYNKGLEDGKKAIEALPPAQPERPKGEWIDLDSDTEKYDDIMCSNCKQSFTVDAYRWCDIGFTVDDLKFCPNCGAYMKGGAI